MPRFKEGDVGLCQLKVIVKVTISSQSKTVGTTCGLVGKDAMALFLQKSKSEGL